MHSRWAATPAITTFLLAALVLSACGGDQGDSAPANDPAQFAAENLAANPDSQRDADSGTSTDDTVADADTDPAPLDPTQIPGEPVNQYNLSVRDCFDQIEDRSDGLPVTITTKLPCDEPHHFEVFAQLTYPAEHPSIYPGDAVIRDYALASCYRKFSSWVGSEYELSDLEIGVIIPTQENFESNAARYRGIHCWVRHEDGEPMIGTSRDSGW
ncbi:MAG: hypothetical protein R2707_09720 [Acidimicrobiales bacterium]